MHWKQLCKRKCEQTKILDTNELKLHNFHYKLDNSFKNISMINPYSYSTNYI